MKASVIIPTHNRADKLADMLDHLRRQSLASDNFEIIVVDDGSSPPVTLAEGARGPRCTLLRMEGLERSAARNRGAGIAEGEVLIFVDDDTVVRHDFVASHLGAHAEWPSALVVGANRLSDAALATPFGQFRQRLELKSLPERRGPTDRPNFCTAQNMSINRDVFRKLEGFAPDIISGEDQDLALRHTSRGGRIVFLPEAMTIHHDAALDVRSYCRRAEWGAHYLIAFCRRHPDWPDNVERERVNGPVRLGREPLKQSLRKLIKRAAASNAILAALFAAATLLERAAPDSPALDRVYRLLLGAHILLGYRKGLKRFGPVRGAAESLADAITPSMVALSDE